MHKNRLLIFLFIIFIGLFSCSRRSHPSRNNPTTVENNNSNNSTINNATIERKSDSAAAVKKAIAKRNAKPPLPKVISVNDEAAHKSIDGRLYYDVMGHRYWRNYKDGKYYLFNKSMFSDPDFKAPK
jgi:hypothetical protein